MDTNTTIVLSVGFICVTAAVFHFIKLGRSAARAATDAATGVFKPFGNVVDAIADRIKGKTQELAKLRLENEKLSGELERIKSQKVTVHAFESVFQVALATFDMQCTDFAKRTIYENSPAMGRQERHEYLGVIRKDYKQTLGVDFKKLLFNVEGSNVFVKGLFDIEVLGFKNPKTTHLIAERRIFKTGSSMLPDSTQITTGYEKELREQLAFMEDRMSHNQFAESINRMIGNMALRVIQILVGESFRVQAVEHMTHGMGFLDFINAINATRDEEARRLQFKLQGNKDQMNTLEAEIREIPQQVSKEKEESRSN